jgi:hypothetical protein
MEHSTIGTPPATGVRGPHADADADTEEPYIPHFRSLTMPGLAKGPIIPEWLSKFFRRKDTPASR